MTIENEKVPEVKAEVVDENATTLVDTIFDIGLAWAEFGVGQGKKALETSAKTLEKVAASLSDLQQKLRKDAAA
ncbi:MAG TPA: hypothetical protein VGG39_32355 [Polyangiaceae bacterium]|jgi:hypothetical protein